MSDILKRVDNTVSIVIGWVDAPFVASVRMASVLDSIGYWVSHAWVESLHVDLQSETALSLLIHAILHVEEELEVLID
jgi:hypothetical protein